MYHAYPVACSGKWIKSGDQENEQPVARAGALCAFEEETLITTKILWHLFIG
jgi:hypothetical protein